MDSQDLNKGLRLAITDSIRNIWDSKFDTPAISTFIKENLTPIKLTDRAIDDSSSFPIQNERKFTKIMFYDNFINHQNHD